MLYIIYDTNEYLKIGGKKHQSFDEIMSRVDDLRQCELQKFLQPIFNTTVAFELISHLLSHKTTIQNWYIRACYALYYHCLVKNVVITKNPTFSYVEQLLSESNKTQRTIGFLKELYENPSVNTIERNKELIIEIKQYLHSVQSNWLKDLKDIRTKFHHKEDEKRRMRDFINSADYPLWRANAFLEGVLRVIPYKVDKVSIINNNTINDFISQHPTYIEIWRRFDDTYMNGGYVLDDDKKANTFWDAEICYFVGTTINDNIVCVASEEDMIHTAAKKANQGKLLFKKSQILNSNNVN